MEKLHRDYDLTTPAHDTDGHIAKFTGWFANVEAGGHQLRFAQLARQSNCWCFGHWKGYALAKP